MVAAGYTMWDIIITVIFGLLLSVLSTGMDRQQTLFCPQGLV